MNKVKHSSTCSNNCVYGGVQFEAGQVYTIQTIDSLVWGSDELILAAIQSGDLNVLDDNNNECLPNDGISRLRNPIYWF